MDILVRKRIPSDIPFIFDSWMKSWRISKWAGCVPNHLFFESQRVLIEDLIARGAWILVAHPSGQLDTIIGWACAEQKDEKCVLHYLYYKDAFRGLGVADLLLAALPGSKPGYITHKLPEKLFKEWRHTPEMARRKAL